MNKFISFFSFASVTFSAFSDQCPSGDKITFTRNSDRYGTLVNVPEGYKLGYTSLFDSTTYSEIFQPTLFFVSFFPDMKKFALNKIKNVKVQDEITCWYSFKFRYNETRPYDSQVFTLSKNGSNLFYDLGKDWISEIWYEASAEGLYGRAYRYHCVLEDQKDCSFSVSLQQ